VVPGLNWRFGSVSWVLDAVTVLKEVGIDYYGCNWCIGKQLELRAWFQADIVVMVVRLGRRRKIELQSQALRAYMRKQRMIF
jgi:hypothetical protein